MKFFLSILIILFITALFSCQQAGLLSTMENLDNQGNTAPEEVSTQDAYVGPTESSEEPIYLFDFSNIKIVPTDSIDIKIKNCFLYQDIYGDLLVFGEILNNSNISKTNLEITCDFSDRFAKSIDFIKISASVEYLQPGKRMPFCIVYEGKAKYLDVGEVKIGANFKNYNQSFSGLPIIANENFSYYDDKMIIAGTLINLGSSEIESIKIIATFYNLKNKVVFFRECYIEKNSLLAQETEDFSLSVLIDEYIPDFTHYRLEVFFRDSFKVR